MEYFTSFFRRLLRFWFLLSVAAITLAASPSLAGAPWPPELVSPANGSTATSNPPTLCARTAGDPEGEPVQIRFEVHGGGEGDHISPWLAVTSPDGVVCWTDTGLWSAQGHAWQARAMDSGNSQSGASPEWGINIPAPATPMPLCTIDTLSVNPAPPQVVGTIVSITASATCSNGVQALRFRANGNELQTVNAASATISWDSAGYPLTDNAITVEAADSLGGYIGSRSHSYTLVSPIPTAIPTLPPTSPSPSCSVQMLTVSPTNGNPGTIFTIAGSGSCNSGVRAIRLKVDGGIIYEIGAPSVSKDWNSSGTPNGMHTATIEIAANGDNNWQAAASRSVQFTIGSPPPPVPTSGTPTCSVNSFVVSPMNGNPGTSFNLSGSGSCNSGVRAMRLKIDGGIIYEIGAPSVSQSWNSSGASIGIHTATIEIAGNGDNNWQAAASRSVQFTIGSPPPPPSPPPQTPVDYGSPVPVGSRSLQVTTDVLNIRGGPGTTYLIVGRAMRNGYFEILEGPLNAWYRIRFSAGQGWVSAQYVQVVTNPAPQPPAPAFVWCDARQSRVYRSLQDGFDWIIEFRTHIRVEQDQLEPGKRLNRSWQIVNVDLRRLESDTSGQTWRMSIGFFGNPSDWRLRYKSVTGSCQ